ncbi:MAG: DUF4190 domain-containing protein [bacterium]|nr:DUF4190 domain-containing protein [bacterium]
MIDGSEQHPADTATALVAPIPTARPVDGSPREVSSIAPHPETPVETCAATAPPDGLAVASAICGMTAFIPIISQLAAVLLGFIALRRIRRARRAGVAVRGDGWAVTGIVSGLIVLAGWIGAAMLLTAAGTIFLGVSEQISLPPG